MAGPASSRPDRNWLETSPRTATSPPASVPPMTSTGRWPGRADLVDLRAEGAHRVDHLRHRSLAHAVRGIDASVPLAQPRDAAAGTGSSSPTGEHR